MRALLILIPFLACDAAWAGPSLALLTGVHKSLARPDADIFTGQVFTPSVGFQAGLEVGLPLSSALQLDVGGFYFHSKTSTSLAGVEGDTITADHVSVPLQLRLRPVRFFSVAGGAYYDFHVSEGTQDDYGYLGSARISIPMGKSSLVLDARYLGGLKGAVGGKARNWVGMLGVSFGGK